MRFAQLSTGSMRPRPCDPVRATPSDSCARPSAEDLRAAAFRPNGINPLDPKPSLLNSLKEMNVSDHKSLQSRRNALKCLAYGGAGTLFPFSHPPFTPNHLTMARSPRPTRA